MVIVLILVSLVIQALVVIADILHLAGIVLILVSLDIHRILVSLDIVDLVLIRVNLDIARSLDILVKVVIVHIQD